MTDRDKLLEFAEKIASISRPDFDTEEATQSALFAIRSLLRVVNQLREDAEGVG